jgi:hypothetical protein
MTRYTDYDEVQWLIREKKALCKLAKKIKNIPKRYVTNGVLDLDKVQLALYDYQKGERHSS